MHYKATPKTLNLTHCHCSAENLQVVRCRSSHDCLLGDLSPDWETHPHCLWALSPRFPDKAEGKRTSYRGIQGRSVTRSRLAFFSMQLTALPASVHFGIDLSQICSSSRVVSERVLGNPFFPEIFFSPEASTTKQKYVFRSLFDMRGKANFQTKQCHHPDHERNLCRPIKPSTGHGRTNGRIAVCTYRCAQCMGRTRFSVRTGQATASERQLVCLPSLCEFQELNKLKLSLAVQPLGSILSYCYYGHWYVFVHARMHMWLSHTDYSHAFASRLPFLCVF